MGGNHEIAEINESISSQPALEAQRVLFVYFDCFVVSSCLEFEGKINRPRRMRERADGNEIDSGRSDGRHRLKREAGS